MSSKLKRLAKDTVLYGISTIVGRFINFILVPLYTNIFLPAEYGIVANVYAIIALCNIIFLFGMDTAYLKYAGMSNDIERPRLFVQAFYAILLIDVVASAALLLFLQPVANLVGIPAEHYQILYYTAAILILDAITSLPFIALRLQKKALRFSAIKLINIGCNIIMNVVLVVVLRMGIESVFISNFVASLLTLLLLLPTIRENLSATFDAGLLKKLFKFGIPYLPAGIASMFMQVIDRPIVEKMAGMKMLGIYQANYRLGIFMMLFVSMFQYAWQPFFLEQAKEENAKPLFASVFTYFTATGVLILIVLSLFINDLVMLSVGGVSLIGKAYWEGLPIVPVVLLGYLFNGFHVVFSAGLFIKEKSIAFPLILTVGAVANVIVNILLIPYLGIMGAALATLVSYLLMAIMFYHVSNTHYPITYENKKLLAILIITTAATVLYYIVFPQIQQNLFLKTALLIAVIAMFFITGVFSKQSLQLLLRKKAKA